jgi:hypothetical protein
MATRSFILNKNSDSNYSGVYCHFDGYPEGVGATLKSYYNTPEKVANLIEHGSISYLKKTIKESRFYHSWRKDPLVIQRGIDLAKAKSIASHMGCEYMYVFEDGDWRNVILE